MYCDEFKKENLSLVDRRGLKRKQQYLSELLRNDEGVLVFINTLKQMEKVKKIFSGRRNLFFTHQGNIPEGQLKGKVQHLLLYDLPLRHNRLKKLIAFLEQNSYSGEITLHLLYGESEFRENLTLLLATVPSAASLEQVFHFLREMAAAGSLTLNSAREDLLHVLPFPATRTLLEKSMAILTEAAYLEVSGEKISIKGNVEEDYCSFLKELRRMQSFSSEKERWRETITWQKYLLEAEGEALLDYLKEA